MHCRVCRSHTKRKFHNSDAHKHPAISQTNKDTAPSPAPAAISTKFLNLTPNAPQNRSNTSPFIYIRGAPFQYRKPRMSSSIYEIRAWIFGEDFISLSRVPLDAKNSFVRSLTWDERRKLDNISYSSFLPILQYPKEKDLFDVNFKKAGENVTIIRKESGKVFSNITVPYDKNWMLSNPTLKQAFTDDGVKDTFKEYSVIIEEPWILIDPVGDHKIGDKFDISGTMNLPKGEDLYIEMVPVSLLEKKYQCQCSNLKGMVTGTARIINGGNAINHWFFSVDASSFTQEKHLIAVNGVSEPCQAFTSINITAAE
jgi:hypothetical protein